MKNMFAKMDVKKKDLPPKFKDVWSDFCSFYSEKYPFAKFEKNASNEVGKFYLSFRPLREAAGTYVFAVAEVLDEGKIKFRLSDSLEWKCFSKSSELATSLSFFMNSMQTQSLLKTMEEINLNGPFEGYVLDCLPYEISPTSVKFALTGDETDSFLKIANGDNEEEEKVGKITSCVVSRIVNNVYPRTSMRFKTNNDAYKYILFQGFLFDFKKVEKDKKGNWILTGCYRRAVRM